MTIYIDTDYKCYITPASDRKLVETDAFDGKCPAYIEGYRFVPTGETWVREDGAEFIGEMVGPWKPWEELDAAQREYERQQLEEAVDELREIAVQLGADSFREEYCERC